MNLSYHPPQRLQTQWFQSVAARQAWLRLRSVLAFIAFCSALCLLAPTAARAQVTNADPQTCIEGQGGLFTICYYNLTTTAPQLTATIYWADDTTTQFTLNNTSGAIQAVHTYAEEGTYQPSVVIGAPGYTSVTGSTTVTVLDAPLGSYPYYVLTSPGVNASRAVAHFIDYNPMDGITDCSATIDWGDGTTSQGTVTPNAAYGGYDVIGSHAYAASTAGASFPVKTTITDIGGASVQISGTANVITGATLTCTEGVLTHFLAAYFNDTGYNLASGNFNYSIDWGDGTASSGTLVLPAPTINDGGTLNGVFYTNTVNDDHAYMDEGNYTVTVTVTENDGMPNSGTSNTVTSSVSVTDGALWGGGWAFLMTAGKASSRTVAYFVDVDPTSTASDFGATIDWGDGVTSLGTVVAAPNNNGENEFYVLGSHAYSAASAGSTFNITAYVIDDGGATSTLTGGYAYLPVAVPIQAAAGQGGSYYTAYFNAPSALFTSTYPSTIDWGDGTTSQGTFTGSGYAWSFDGMPFNSGIVGTHTYATSGSYVPITTIYYQQAGDPNNGTFGIAVAAGQTSNPVPVLSKISPTTVLAAGKSFVLVATGSSFTPSSVIAWNGEALTTSFVSATQIKATIPAALIASPGKVSITVVNPTPGGGTSTAKALTIAVTSIKMAVGAPTRDATTGLIIVPISLQNAGHLTASNLTINSSKLGTKATTTALPLNLGSPAAGSLVQTSLTFPGSAGTTGTKLKLAVSGAYTGGTFSSSATITLP